jgi:hypothetical protein
LLGAGGYFYRHQGSSKTEVLALKALARDFEGHVSREEFFQPDDNNAASTIRDMLEIKPSSKIAKNRIKQLLSKLKLKLDALLAAGKSDSAEAILADAGAAKLFAAEQLQVLSDKIADAHVRAALAPQLEAELAQAQSQLKAGDSAVDWIVSMAKLRAASGPENAGVSALSKKLELAFIAETEVALVGADVRAARIALAKLQVCAPENTVLARYQKEVEVLASKQDPAARLEQLKNSLAAPVAAVADIYAARAELDALKVGTNDPPTLTQIESSLVQKVVQWVQTNPAEMSKAGALMQALGSYGKSTSAQPALDLISAGNARVRAQALLGTLDISAATPARLLGIYRADETSEALPTSTQTPLSLRLPAGLYRLEFADEAGRKTSVAAKIGRGKRAKLSVIFGTGNDQSVEEEERE